MDIVSSQNEHSKKIEIKKIFPRNKKIYIYKKD